MKKYKFAALIAAMTASCSIAGCSKMPLPDEISADASQDSSYTDADSVSPAESDPIETVDTPETSNTVSDTSVDPVSDADPIETTETDAPETTVPTAAPVTYKTIASASEPELVDADEPIPSNDEIYKLAGTNIRNAESFVVTCNVSGKTHLGSANLPLDHNYTLAVTKDVTYLNSTYNYDETHSVWEKYTMTDRENFDPTQGTPLVFVERTEDGWVNDLRKGELWNNVALDYLWVNDGWDDMVIDTIKSYALLTFIDPDYTYEDDDPMATATSARDENGNIVMTFPEWDEWLTLDTRFNRPNEKIIFNALNSLFRANVGNHPSTDISYRPKGNAVYTFDNDYNIKSIEGNMETNTEKFHFTIEFSNWNNVAPIEVPEYETIRP